MRTMLQLGENCSSRENGGTSWSPTVPHMATSPMPRQFHATATEIFHGSDVNITADGKRHLGSALGSPSFIETYVQGKVTRWVEEVKHLATTV